MKKLFLVLMLMSGTGWCTFAPNLFVPANATMLCLELDNQGNPKKWVPCPEKEKILERIEALESRVKILEGRLDQALDRVKKLEEKRGIVVDTDEHYYSGVSSDGVHYMKIK